MVVETSGRDTEGIQATVVHRENVIDFRTLGASSRHVFSFVSKVGTFSWGVSRPHPTPRHHSSLLFRSPGRMEGHCHLSQTPGPVTVPSAHSHRGDDGHRGWGLLRPFRPLQRVLTQARPQARPDAPPPGTWVRVPSFHPLCILPGFGREVGFHRARWLGLGLGVSLDIPPWR